MIYPCLLMRTSAPFITPLSWRLSTSSTTSPQDLHRATPCEDWNLSQLLAHMTAHHRGFAAAARGDGANPAHCDTTAGADAVNTDPAGAYAAAAADVLEAFAEDDALTASFALPE